MWQYGKEGRYKRRLEEEEEACIEFCDSKKMFCKKNLIFQQKVFRVLSLK